MKHEPFRETAFAPRDPEATGTSPLGWFATAARRQGRLSWLVTFACALLLVAVVADGPVRQLARSLDPSVVAVLRAVTRFGNSAWPVGLSLLFLAATTIVSRRPNPFAPEMLGNLRSALILVIGSVMISGTIASLTKNMIGRARPSMGPDTQVFEFAMMSFRASWASFPSGHATTAMAGAIALAVIFPRQAFAWLAIGLTAALSRAFLGVHWLTDCLAGIALGALVSLTLRRWMEAPQHKFQVEPAFVLRVSVLGCILALGAGYRLTKEAVRRAGRFLRLAATRFGNGPAPRP